MTYLPQSGFWDWLGGGSGETGTVADKTPANAPDLIKLWAGMKRNLADRFGIYRFADGSPVVVWGRMQPQLTYEQGSEIAKFWTDLGTKISADLASQGKLSNMFLKARATWAADWADWILYANSFEVDGRTTPNGYLGKYMFFASTDKLMEAIANYVVGMSSGIWSGYNIESIYDRAMSVMPFLLKPVFAAGWATAHVADVGIKGVCDAGVVRDICNAASGTMQIMKWLLIGSAVFGGVYLISKARGQHSVPRED